MGFPSGSVGKNLPVVQETPVQSLGWEDPLEKGKYSDLENSTDYIVHGVAKSGTRLSNFHFHIYVCVCVCVCAHLYI